MALMLQLIFTLFTLSSNTECSDVFVSVGDSVQLHTQEPLPEFTTFIWKFNKTEKVLEYLKKYNDATAFPRLKDRVAFNNENYSLTLKNLQKTDSGLYEAIVSGQKDTEVAAYNLSVWDPVEAPVLIYQLKKETCNITVSCRTHHLSVNSSCDKKTCEERKVSALGLVCLSLFVSSSSIICNHSNPVSWKMDILEMEKLDCSNEDAVSPSAGVSVCLLKIVLFSTALILMVSAVITVHVNSYCYTVNKSCIM
ncbi:SLAM family member 7-like [Hoplias malabaricus]|uniref:SLAM family member 7-like n=1 Tax=Hoplias malabaricus TaxID=27720 RepID=UPI003461CA21